MLISERHAPVANRIMRGIMRFHPEHRTRVAVMAKQIANWRCVKGGVICDMTADHYHEHYADAVITLWQPDMRKAQGLRLVGE